MRTLGTWSKQDDKAVERLSAAQRALHLFDSRCRHPLRGLSVESPRLAGYMLSRHISHATSRGRPRELYVELAVNQRVESNLFLQWTQRVNDETNVFIKVHPELFDSLADVVSVH